MQSYLNDTKNTFDIVKSNDKDKIIKYIEDTILFSELNEFIEQLFINYTYKSFKYEKLYDIFYKIYLRFFSKNTIKTYELNEDFENIFFNFIIELVKINKSQNILYKLESDYELKKCIINNQYYENSINKLINVIVKFSTLPVIIYFSSLIPQNYSINLMFKNILYNTDDRVYKYVIKDLNYGTKINALDKISISSCLTSIFNDNIPNKYKLRRIKFISNYININDHIEKLVSFIRDYDLLYTFLKYNFVKLNNNINSYNWVIMFNNISELCNDDDYDKCKFKITSIYNLISSNFDKNIFYITFSVILNESFDFKLIKNDINYGDYLYDIYKYNNFIINNRKFIKDIDNKSYYHFIKKNISSLDYNFNILAIYKYINVWEISNDTHYKNMIIKLNTASY
jgi:hypothetical protein